MKSLSALDLPSQIGQQLSCGVSATQEPPCWCSLFSATQFLHVFVHLAEPTINEGQTSDTQAATTIQDMLSFAMDTAVAVKINPKSLVI